MRKRSRVHPAHTGLAILAGAFSFAGNAGAVTLFYEGFEGGVNLFSAPTYAYSLNYTQPGLPGSGLNYMHGGAGTQNAVSSKTFTATVSPISLLTGGVTAAGIDSGLVSYNLYAQFSTYLSQGDHGTVRIQFLDAGSSPLGSLITVGGSAFVGGLGADGGGYRAWGADSIGGTVPTGARSVALDILETKAAPGTIIDGYIDNVTLELQVVPEPTAPALLGLGTAMLAWLRRRR